MEPVKPDYDGAWVGAVVPALLDGEHPPWLPAPVAGAAGVLLLVLDGLGWNQLTARRERLPHLGAMAGGPVTTVAPSTTSAALTSISTGLAPAGHGIVGYRMRLGSEVLNVLAWQTSKGAPDTATVQPHPPFAGRSLPVITRAEFERSGFTKAHLRGVRFVGWRTAATLVEHCRRQTRGTERVVYAYYDGIDKVAHGHGLHDGFYDVELFDVDRIVGELLAGLPENWVLVVTSDHGQVHVEPDDQVELAAVLPLVSTVAGEGRFRSLHARPGATADLLAAANDCYGKQAWVLTRDQLFDDGWLGAGASLQVRGRVGDVVLAAREPVVFIDPGFTQERRLRSFHGSLTPDEMLVPLVAARGAG